MTTKLTGSTVILQSGGGAFNELVVLCCTLQLAASRPQSRVTFSGAQLRNYSVGSGSSTSGSCSSRHSDAADRSSVARQTSSSQLSVPEDFQGACVPQRHRTASRSDVDPDAFGRCSKKAKMVQETSVRDESPFVKSAADRSLSFASPVHSSADEPHFWSKLSTPRHEKSFTEHNIHNIESPLSGMNEDRSSFSGLSLSRTYNEPVRRPVPRQASQNYDKCCPNGQSGASSARREKNMNLFRPTVSTECMPLYDVKPIILQTALSANIRTVSSDGGCRQSAANVDTAAASNATSDKWRAFVRGIASESSHLG